MKMKKPNKHVVKAVAVATAVGSMLPACQPYLDNLIIQSQDLPARGAHAIELNFTQAELRYLRFIQQLSNDIVQHPMIAQAFARNPQLFLEKYGFHEPIDLDDGMLKLVLALGDPDINSAVNAGDVRLVLSLMEEKGILNDLANSNFSINISDEQKKDLLLSMGFDESEVEFLAACTPIGILAVACLVAGVWGVIVAIGFYFTVAAVNAVGVAALAGIYLAVYLEIEVIGVSNSGSKFLDNNLPLKVWSLKGKPNDTYIAVNIRIEDEVNKLIDLVKSHNVSFDENKMREFMKLNILMQNR